MSRMLAMSHVTGRFLDRVDQCEHIKAETRWLPFHRHFHTYFLELILLYFYSKFTKYTGDPLHSRAACTQPCNVNTHSRAHCFPGARLCEQWGHGCVNNGARLCAIAWLCRGSPVNIFPGIKLSKCQHWFRWRLGAEQATSHHLNQCWPSLLVHIWVTQRVKCVCVCDMNTKHFEQSTLKCKRHWRRDWYEKQSTFFAIELQLIAQYSHKT